MYDVITIGSATRDVFVRSAGLQTIRSSRFKTGFGECVPFGEKVAVDELIFTVGGSAANTAVTFARWGFRAAAVAKVGDDIRGSEIIKVLRGERVNTSSILRDRRHQTAYSMILLAPSGERTVLTYRGAESEITDRELALPRLQAKWFYVTHLGGRSAALFPKALRHADSIGAKIAVNPGKTQLTMPLRKLLPLLNLVDVFIVNREEGSRLTKVPYRDENRIFKKLDAWVRGLVIMTDGPRGVTVSDGTMRWKAGVLKERKVVDRTGAGDAFGSGFVAVLAEHSARTRPPSLKLRRTRPPSLKLRRADADLTQTYADIVPKAIQAGSANATSVIEHIGAQRGILHKRDSITRRGKLYCDFSAIRSR